MTRSEVNRRYHEKHNKFSKMKKKADLETLNETADIEAQQIQVELLSKRYFKTPSKFRTKVGRELLDAIYYLQALRSE
jgi:hypothetical protein